MQVGSALDEPQAKFRALGTLTLVTKDLCQYLSYNGAKMCILTITI